MKISTASIASLLVYIGLPASFAATALHEPAVQKIASESPVLFQSHSAFLAPLLFVSAVMSVAAILVHHLREEQRLNIFASLHLRHSTTAIAPQPQPKARLAKAAAI